MRLDAFLVKNGTFISRNKANESIKRGEIYVDGKVNFKPAFDVCENNLIELKRVCTEFVSVGGFKLEKALNDFSFDVNGLVACDIGSSTGGFTDCLIKRGVNKVYAVDLNDDLMDKSLKENEKVKRIIKNAKLLTNKDFDDDIDLIVADLSFISATAVMDVFAKIVDNDKDIILLIKPQFENGEKKHFKNGIVNDKSVRKDAVKKVCDCVIDNGLYPVSITTAPLNKGKNVEYLIWLKKGIKSEFSLDNYNF